MLLIASLMQLLGFSTISGVAISLLLIIETHIWQGFSGVMYEMHAICK